MGYIIRKGAGFLREWGKGRLPFSVVASEKARVLERTETLNSYFILLLNYNIIIQLKEFELFHQQLTNALTDNYFDVT